MNVLSFFSFENRTHSRFSHSLPSSAATWKEKNQTRISKLFFCDFRFLILCQLCSDLLNMVSHPSSFSATIVANPSWKNTTYLLERYPRCFPSVQRAMSLVDFLAGNLVHCPISTFITNAKEPLF